MFEEELAGLISEAAAASSPPTTTPAVAMPTRNCPSTDPRLKKRAHGDLGTASKRQKLETALAVEMSESESPLPKSEGSSSGASTMSEPNVANVDAHALHVQPSRRVLLDRPDAQQLRDFFLGSHDGPPNHPWPPLGSPPTNGTPRTILTATSSPPEVQDMTTETAGLYPTKKIWVTLRNVIQRQVNPRKDDMAYEALLKLRHEPIENIDRYVPPPGNPKPPKRTHPTIRRRNESFPFEKLPELVQCRILELLLVWQDHIRVDFTWLRPFFQGHARVLSAYTSIEHEGVQYEVPTTWNKVVVDVATMQSDMSTFKTALDERAYKTRPTRGPCRGLTTSLLRVSRNMHKQAARIFYGQNTFSFPWAATAWMQLESFLVIVGPTNVAEIRSLHVHVPLWHQGIYHDFIEAAVLDLTSPVSRLAIIKPPAHDRLVSAIEYCVSALLRAARLAKLELRIENGQMAEQWPSHVTNGGLIAMTDADEHTRRKQKGVELLSQLSKGLNTAPMLKIFHCSRYNEKDKSTFRGRLAGLGEDAGKYGWKVSPQLVHGM